VHQSSKFWHHRKAHVLFDYAHGSKRSVGEELEIYKKQLYKKYIKILDFLNFDPSFSGITVN